MPQGAAESVLTVSVFLSLPEGVSEKAPLSRPQARLTANTVGTARARAYPPGHRAIPTTASLVHSPLSRAPRQPGSP